MNYFSDLVFCVMLVKLFEEDGVVVVRVWVGVFGKVLIWVDMVWLRLLIKLLLILKGICYFDDVWWVIDEGVDVIYCLNYGGC